MTWPILSVILGWFLLCGCTFRMEGQRVWIGPNAATDWIDIGSQHRIINGEIVTYFDDPSPIQTATLLDRGGCSWLIEKAGSWWWLEDTNQQPDGYLLHRITIPLELGYRQQEATNVVYTQP